MASNFEKRWQRAADNLDVFLRATYKCKNNPAVEEQRLLVADAYSGTTEMLEPLDNFNTVLRNAVSACANIGVPLFAK